MWSLEGADMALETAHMNQEISWGPVLCGLSRVPAKHFSNTSHFDLKRSSPLLPVLPQDVTGNTSTWQWRRDFVCMYYSAVPLSFQTKHLRAILTRRVSWIPQDFFLFGGKWLWFLWKAGMLYSYQASRFKTHPSLWRHEKEDGCYGVSPGPSITCSSARRSNRNDGDFNNQTLAGKVNEFVFQQAGMRKSSRHFSRLTERQTAKKNLRTPTDIHRFKVQTTLDPIDFHCMAKTDIFKITTWILIFFNHINSHFSQKQEQKKTWRFGVGSFFSFFKKKLLFSS